MANSMKTKPQVFLAVAKGYKNMGGRPQGCWGCSRTLGSVHNGLNLIHDPLGQNKMTQHRGQKTSRYKIDDCGRIRTDMDVRSELLESRHDNLSTKYLNSPIRVHMRLWRPSQVVVFLQSESNSRTCWTWTL